MTCMQAVIQDSRTYVGQLVMQSAWHCLEGAIFCFSGGTSLLLQKGAGAYVPENIVPRGKSEGQLANGLEVKIFEFAPQLDSYMRAAGLVISHAGSGSLFEALGLRKPLIAVPNAILMANHQAELVSLSSHT